MSDLWDEINTSAREWDEQPDGTKLKVGRPYWPTDCTCLGVAPRDPLRAAASDLHGCKLR